jgi:hypothetical protein
VQNITVGKKQNVTFIPLDQFGNPNPVGPDGVPLKVAGVPVWTLTDASGAPLTGGGFALAPSTDGMSCDVAGGVAGTVGIIVCTADRGDGVLVTGQADITCVPVQGPALVIGSLLLQFGPETERTPK